MAALKLHPDKQRVLDGGEMFEAELVEKLANAERWKELSALWSFAPH